MCGNILESNIVVMQSVLNEAGVLKSYYSDQFQPEEEK